MIEGEHLLSGPDRAFTNKETVCVTSNITNIELDVAPSMKNTYRRILALLGETHE